MSANASATSAGGNKSGGPSGCKQPAHTFSSGPSRALGLASAGSTFMSTVTNIPHCRPVTESDLAAVEEVLKVEIDLLDSASRKVQFLESTPRKEANRIIGLQYSMDDRKSAAKDSEKATRMIESKLMSLDFEITEIMQTVIARRQERGSSDAESDLMVSKIILLTAKKESTARRLEMARSFGFQELDVELQEKAFQLDVSKATAELKYSLQEESGLLVLNWSWSSMKQSDFGSSTSTYQTSTVQPVNLAMTLLRSCVILASDDKAPQFDQIDAQGDEVDSPAKCSGLGIDSVI